MFRNASSFNQLIDTWEMSNKNKANVMFRKCPILPQNKPPALAVNDNSESTDDEYYDNVDVAGLSIAVLPIGEILYGHLSKSINADNF
jgi:hypothetical protein